MIVGHVLVLAAALTCLRLGWWQWEVTESDSGTAQNLGYSLLWPVFAGSFIYMWLRFLQLEGDRDRELAAAADADPVLGDDPGAPAPPGYGGTLTAGLDGPDGTGTGGTRHRSSRPPLTRRDRTAGPPGATTSVTGIGYIGPDDVDDPELAAYNAALAQLAEQERRRER